MVWFKKKTKEELLNQLTKERKEARDLEIRGQLKQQIKEAKDRKFKERTRGIRTFGKSVLNLADGASDVDFGFKENKFLKPTKYKHKMKKKKKLDLLGGGGIDFGF